MIAIGLNLAWMVLLAPSTPQGSSEVLAPGGNQASVALRTSFNFDGGTGADLADLLHREFEINVAVPHLKEVPRLRLQRRPEEAAGIEYWLQEIASAVPDLAFNADQPGALRLARFPIGSPRSFNPVSISQYKLPSFVELEGRRDSSAIQRFRLAGRGELMSSITVQDLMPDSSADGLMLMLPPENTPVPIAVRGSFDSADELFEYLLAALGATVREYRDGEIVRRVVMPEMNIFADQMVETMRAKERYVRDWIVRLPRNEDLEVSMSYLQAKVRAEREVAEAIRDRIANWNPTWEELQQRQGFQFPLEDQDLHPVIVQAMTHLEKFVRPGRSGTTSNVLSERLENIAPRVDLDFRNTLLFSIEVPRAPGLVGTESL